MTITANPEKVGLATFVDEAAVCAEVDGSTSSHYSILDTSAVQSIKDYLARPRLVAEGNITPGAGLLTYISIDKSSILRGLLSNVNFDRLKGAVGFRATLKWTVVVSATPFHQGILNLAWQYAVDPNVAGDTNYTRAFFYPLVKNLPHVDLDISANTMVSLEVPYVNSLEYFPIDLNSEFDMVHGVVSLTKMTNPRVVEGQTQPEYALYLSLHDMEMIGAVPYNFRVVTLQSGLGNKSIATLEKQHMGLLSAPLESFANAARAISDIPMLNNIGGKADWFLRSAAKAASAFGFSKPVDEVKPMRINRMTYAGDSHIDMPFQGFTTSPFISNKLAINSAVGCVDEDQMAFNYVLTKPSLIYRGQFNQASATGDVLYGSYVSINSFWYRDREVGPANISGNIPHPGVATGTKNCFLPSTLLYIGSNFRYWRGDLRFKITFSKSKMHGGRVQFTYIPYTSNPAANLTLGNDIAAPEAPANLVQPTGLSTVFDLRDGAEFEYVVPYLCTDPYMTLAGATGAISMTVVNSLRAPGVSASEVDFMVEVSAEPNFEFACYCPSMLDGLSNSGNTDIVYQSGISATVNDASQNAIGERFMSLKQLAMIPSWSNAELANNTITRITMTPWFKSNAVPVTAPFGTSVNETAIWLASPCSRVARMFAFVNGGTTYVFNRDGGSTINFTANSLTFPNTAGAIYTEAANVYNKLANSSSTLTLPETGEVARWFVPTYSRFLRLPHSRMFTATGGWQRAMTPGGSGEVNYNPGYFSNRVDLALRNTSGSTRRYIIGKAAGDDARASQFIGPPPVALYLATATTSPVSNGASAYSNSAW